MPDIHHVCPPLSFWKKKHSVCINAMIKCGQFEDKRQKMDDKMLDGDQEIVVEE